MSNPIKTTIGNCTLLLLAVSLFLTPLIYTINGLSQDYPTWQIILTYLILVVAFGWLPIRVIERIVKGLKRLIRQHEEEKNNQKE